MQYKALRIRLNDEDLKRHKIKHRRDLEQILRKGISGFCNQKNIFNFVEILRSSCINSNMTKFNYRPEYTLLPNWQGAGFSEGWED